MRKEYCDNGVCFKLPDVRVLYEFPRPAYRPASDGLFFFPPPPDIREGNFCFYHLIALNAELDFHMRVD